MKDTLLKDVILTTAPHQDYISVPSPVRFDLPLLRRVCLAPEKQFTQLPGAQVVVPDANPTTRCIYIDNGAPVLGVAHLDAVQATDHFARIDAPSGDIEIMCGQLDDRLGAFVLLHLLPHMGIHIDVLLTTDEESMQSSAQYFEPPEGKQYNWMFMFDRAGDDVVLYHYDDLPLRKKLQAFGFRIGQGSYSCIAELSHLACKGFNVGTGYENNHSHRAWASLSTLAVNIQKFARFYKEHAHNHMQHDPLDTGWRRWSGATTRSGAWVWDDEQARWTNARTGESYSGSLYSGDLLYGRNDRWPADYHTESARYRPVPKAGTLYAIDEGAKLIYMASLINGVWRIEATLSPDEVLWNIDKDGKSYRLMRIWPLPEGDEVEFKDRYIRVQLADLDDEYWPVTPPDHQLPSGEDHLEFAQDPQATLDRAVILSERLNVWCPECGIAIRSKKNQSAYIAYGMCQDCADVLIAS